MRIEVLTIGDELLLGYTLDTNAAHLARELAACGVEIVRRATVGDDATLIATAVAEALGRSDGVITTGGLGPTSDDLTKPAIAALFGREMRLDASILEAMRKRWQDRGWPGELPLANHQQAMIPDGARVLTNHHGSAPGIWLENESARWVAMLPGVPREMRGMLADTLLPLLKTRVGDNAGVVRSRTLRTTGIGESALADSIASAGAHAQDATLAYLPSYAGTDLRLTVRGRSSAEADGILTANLARLADVAGPFAYGEDDADLAGVVLALCRARGVRIAVAESCTGGMLGMRLTAIAGSSDVVLGGVIAYEDLVKGKLLGVRASDIAEHGAVSEQVARVMASNVKRTLGAEVGIAITGVAGPGGGSPEKPVGTVWIAADVGGDVHARRLNLIGDRHEIRQRATQGALDLVRRKMLASASDPR